MKSKQCITCNKRKKLTAFYTDRRSSDGRVPRCKTCYGKYQSCWRSRHRPSVLRYNRKWYKESGYRYKRYGITKRQYDEAFEKQGGVCAICKKVVGSMHKKIQRDLHIDHDHKRNVFRGLLCGQCNTGIGKFNDDPGRLRQAADYCTPK